MTYTIVGQYFICQVGLALLCDQANAEFANGHAGVFAVQAGVKTCTGLQLQHVLSVVERPNACESPVEVTHYGLSAALQHSLQCTFGPARITLHEYLHAAPLGARAWPVVLPPVSIP